MSNQNGPKGRKSASGARRARAEREVQRLREHPLRPGRPGPRPKGRLLIIGGREDKSGDCVVLRTLAQRVGAGKLVICTVATEHPNESWEEYDAVFRRLGVRHLAHLDIRTREDAESPRGMLVLEEATALFFTGGDQLRITSLLGDTPVYSRLQEIYYAGGTIAGTSAGASVMSETMIVSGESDGSNRIGKGLGMAPGLGLAKDIVIDQHFAERGRIGRLLGVLAQNPRILGIGIDENTAIDLDPFSSLRVIGEGAVYVLDGSKLKETNVAEEQHNRALSLVGVLLHVLSQGDELEIDTRTPTIHAAEDVDEELGVAG